MAICLLFLHSFFFHEPAVLAPSKCSLGLFTHFSRVVGCLTTWKGCIKRSACRLRFARAYASAPRVFVINTVSFPAPLLQNICSIEERERACLWATQYPMRSDAEEKQKCLPPEQNNCPGLLDKNTLFHKKHLRKLSLSEAYWEITAHFKQMQKEQKNDSQTELV